MSERGGGERTVIRSGRKLEWIGFFFGEEAIVGSEPGAILWVGTWVIGETS